MTASHSCRPWCFGGARSPNSVLKRAERLIASHSSSILPHASPTSCLSADLESGLADGLLAIYKAPRDVCNASTTSLLPSGTNIPSTPFTPRPVFTAFSRAPCSSLRSSPSLPLSSLPQSVAPLRPSSALPRPLSASRRPSRTRATLARTTTSRSRPRTATTPPTLRRTVSN